MIVNKWDFGKRKYDKVKIKDDPMIKMYCQDMNQTVKCINCKNIVLYGNTYSSLQYHNDLGLAYPVCPNCYEKEWAIKKSYVENDV